jgi:hypothetical protein
MLKMLASCRKRRKERRKAGKKERRKEGKKERRKGEQVKASQCEGLVLFYVQVECVPCLVLGCWSKKRHLGRKTRHGTPCWRNIGLGNKKNKEERQCPSTTATTATTATVTTTTVALPRSRKLIGFPSTK